MSIKYYSPMKKILVLFSCLLAFEGYGQTPVTIHLEDCYKLARQQYPLIKQQDLIEKTKDYSIQNAAKGYYPQISLNGQATYQSDVTSVPFSLNIPKLGLDLSIPTPNKDQYKVYGEVDQVIYDGGIIKYSKESDVANAAIQEQNLEVELYALNDRVNQLFFGTMLLNEQIKQNEIVQKDIQNSIDKMLEGVKNGTATTTSVDELQAELLQQQQNKIQFLESHKAYLSMLGLLTNQQLDENTILVSGEAIHYPDSIKRPELLFYDEQKRGYDVQEKMLAASNKPKFSFFFQGGYGRPGLNAFDNNFAAYYIGGFRFAWTLGGYYTLNNQRQILDIDKQTSQIQKETFLLNTRLLLKQQSSEMEKLSQMITMDNDIIAKRTRIKEAVKAQMENGMVTTYEYIAALDAEDQAKQNQLLHHVQLLLAEFTFQNTHGN